METLYVLLHVEPGSLEHVIARLKGLALEGVAEVSAVTGSWDIVARVEANRIGDAVGLVMDKIRSLEGVKNTETLVAVNL